MYKLAYTQLPTLFPNQFPESKLAIDQKPLLRKDEKIWNTDSDLDSGLLLLTASWTCPSL